jgi:hypothetical protein
MMLKTMLAMAVTAAAVPLSASWATEPTGPQGTFLWNSTYRYPAFSSMDLNADGIITRGEYAAATSTLPPAAPAVVAPVAPAAAVPCGPGTYVACPPVAYYTPAPVTSAPVTSAPVTYTPASVTYTPASVTYAPAPVTYAPAPVTYAPVVVNAAPFPQYTYYSWHSADSNPPAPPR